MKFNMLFQNKCFNIDKDLRYQLIRPYWTIGAKSIIFSVVSSSLEVVGTALVLPLLEILGENHVSLNLQNSDLLDKLSAFYFHLAENKRLPAILLTLALITIIKNYAVFLSRINENAFFLGAGNLLRKKCIVRFLEMGLPSYTKMNTGELLGYTNEQSQRTESFFKFSIEIIKEIIAITFLLSFLIFLAPTLTLVAIVSLSTIAFFIQIIINKVNLHGQKTTVAIEKFSTLVNEIISGIRVIKSFNAETRTLKNAENALNSRYKAEFTAYKSWSAVGPLTETLGILVLILILFGGTILIGASSNSRTNLPILLTFTLTLLRTIPRVNQLNNLRGEISLFRGSFEVIRKFLMSTESCELKDGVILFTGLKNKIEFKNIFFTYPSNLEPTLKNVNLSILKGSTTAIVGASGCGKSTLLDLLMRFYDPELGSIQIDGINLKNFNIGSWRSNIAMVSQDTFLFNCSIRDNIAYGKINATDDDIINATQRAYAYDFIQEMPDGINTIVGNRGTKLSGGQRQRIAIARAILNDPDILILDEATSALDSNSERMVQKAIDEISTKRTVIVIAHRLSTIEKADNIIVLKDGMVVEKGTQGELLALQGLYHKSYKAQNFSTLK
jgi:ABC-type multidrug transport system fused ATPase/permease subunit